MPTKRLNVQHLIEYLKQLLQEENKKSGNVMQQPMHSYVHGLWYKFEVRQFEKYSSDSDSNKSGKIKKFWSFAKITF